MQVKSDRKSDAERRLYPATSSLNPNHRKSDPTNPAGGVTYLIPNTNTHLYLYLSLYQCLYPLSPHLYTYSNSNINIHMNIDIYIDVETD